MSADGLVFGAVVVFVGLLGLGIGALVVSAQRDKSAGLARLDAWARGRGLVREPVSAILGQAWRGTVEGHAVRVRSGDVLEANESAPSVETVVEVRGARHLRAFVLGRSASRTHRERTDGMRAVTVPGWTEATECSAWSTGPVPSWLDAGASAALPTLRTLVQAGTWDDVAEIRLGERTPESAVMDEALRLALAMARAPDDRGGT